MNTAKADESGQSTVDERMKKTFLGVRLPFEHTSLNREVLDAIAQKKGISRNAYVLRVLNEAIERDAVECLP